MALQEGTVALQEGLRGTAGVGLWHCRSAALFIEHDKQVRVITQHSTSRETLRQVQNTPAAAYIYPCNSELVVICPARSVSRKLTAITGKCKRQTRFEKEKLDNS